MSKLFTTAFGLDIGDRTFKLAQVQRGRGKNGQFRLLGWHKVTVPHDVLVDGEIKDMDRAVECLQTLLKESKELALGRSVVACLPEMKSFVKTVKMPEDTSPEACEKAVTEDMASNIPLPMDELYYDWRLVPNGDSQSLLYIAAPKFLTEDYCTLIERAGLTVSALENEAMSTSRAIVPRGTAKDDTMAVLDLGYTRSNLCVTQGGTMRMSISIPVAGFDFSRALMRELDVNETQADKIKMECGVDQTKCEPKVWQALSPLTDTMAEKLRAALRYYRTDFPSSPSIETISLCGGGSAYPDIDGVLSRKLTLKVTSGDALTNLDGKLPTNVRREDALNYSTAIGLAIRAAEESREGVSLL